jgi:tRNA nucleotidyltransferase (CCA-adding enzyme)
VLKTYLVGGAVRDELLNIPASDLDWVVVGATPDDMVARGYRPVGKDFPVFLHPDTNEEYALARTERKTAAGYHGFTFNTSTEVTLEQDLQRRDLTINAIAKDEKGAIIDPWNGVADLQDRLLRHISPAFAEDPLRVLRVARFAARFAHLGFTIAPETLELMSDLSASGELQTLAAERIWQEMHAALGVEQPEAFFNALRECDALVEVFPELNRLFGVPQPAQHHPEIDCAVHTMLAVRQICLLTRDSATRFATLCHDLGKGTTPKDLLPSHHGHEARGAELCKALCARLRTPAEHRDLAVLTANFHTHCHRALELKPGTLLRLMESLDALRRPKRFNNFLLCCTADARGRLGAESTPYPQADYLRGAMDALRDINAGEIAVQLETRDGTAIAAAIRKAKLTALTDYRRTNAKSDD